MNLSEHFTLEEFTRTSSGLLNVPDADDTDRLVKLCEATLEPWRALGIGRLLVTSGFRSRAVNNDLRARGYSASATSQHLVGEAADIKPLDVSIEAAWHQLVVNARVLEIDQAILYQRRRGKGWIHVSHTARHLPRHELFVQPWNMPGSHLVAWEDWNDADPLVI